MICGSKRRRGFIIIHVTIGMGSLLWAFVTPNVTPNVTPDYAVAGKKTHSRENV